MAAQSEKTSLDNLPSWNLWRHFPYTSILSKQIDDEIAEIEEMSKSFNKKYKSKLGYHMYSAIKEYENLSEKTSEVETFAYLVFSTSQHEPEIVTRYSFIDSKLSGIRAAHLTFFELELSSLDDDKVTEQLEGNDAVKHYEPYIMEVRRLKPHLLTEEVEKALRIRESWASAEPVKDYYEKQMSQAKFFLDGEEMNMENLLSKTMSSDPAVRRASLKAVNKGLGDNAINRFASLSLNVVSGSWHIEMKERAYKNLRSRRNMSNDVPDVVVDSLLSAVRSKGVELSKRYYLLKKSILKKFQGLEDFTWADRNAPLGLPTDDKIYTWEEAKDIVRAGYKKFSPKMAKMFDKMIEEERLDMPAVKGKVSGAYCHGATPRVGPFQFHNYTGQKRDVETLAHESGHGCHDILAYKQGYLQYHPPLTLAETASIFGEMIVFKDLLNKSEDKKEKLGMMMGKLDSLVNSVTRQCQFDRFEELVHTARSDGIVADDQFDKFWIQTIEEYYGKEGEVFDKYEDVQYLWSYVSHFHSVPFYVYAYAFAELLVGSLYNVYEEKPEGFEDKFLSLLSAGSTQNFVTLLQPFDLDPSHSSFWVGALEATMGRMLDETEALAKELDLHQ